MKRLDALINTLKNVLNIILTAFLTLIAYLFVNVETLSKIKLIVACFGLALLIFSLLLVIVFLNKHINNLKE